MEISGGWGSKTKGPSEAGAGGGGVDIVWNYTIYQFSLSHVKIDVCPGDYQGGSRRIERVGRSKLNQTNLT